MRSNTIRERLAAGKTVINGWLSIGSSYSAEGIGHSGAHAVTVDLQHGMLDFSLALQMMQAISATPAIPMVRVPSLDPPKIMQLLDAGAYGIICPMISSVEETRAFIAACRYPPLGNRSFGPSRGLLYGGGDYVAKANETVMAIPMIETADAVERIDDILDVPGIDMIYVGPNDMAFELDGHVNHPRPKSEAAVDVVLKAASRRGISAGIFCSGADEARKRIEQGFRLVTPGNDFAHLTRSMKEAVQALQEDDVPAAPGAVAHGY